MAVRKLGENKYQVDFRYRGKRYVRIVRAPNKKQAEAVVAKYKLSEAQGQYLEVPDKSGLLLSKLAEEYMEYYGKVSKKKSSYKRDITSLKHILPAIGRFYVDDVSYETVLKYKAMRVQQVSKRGRTTAPATINRELALLKSIFYYGIKVNKARINPVRGVGLLAENNQRIRYLTLEERVALHQNAAPHLQSMMLIAENAGLRLSEILYLKKRKFPWKEYVKHLPGKEYGEIPDSYLDWENLTIAVEQSKSGKTRRVPMNRTLTDCLRSYMVGSGSVFVFSQADGRPYRNIRTAFTNAVERAGLADFTFHDLRHDFASQLTMKGVSQFALMELLGHTSTTMSNRYAHLSPEYKRHAVELLDSQNVARKWQE